MAKQWLGRSISYWMCSSHLGQLDCSSTLAQRLNLLAKLGELQKCCQLQSPKHEHHVLHVTRESHFSHFPAPCFSSWPGALEYLKSNIFCFLNFWKLTYSMRLRSKFGHPCPCPSCDKISNTSMRLSFHWQVSGLPNRLAKDTKQMHSGSLWEWWYGLLSR